MPRPLKKGLSYFPLDVDYYDDMKFTELCYYCGLKGEAIVIRLYSLIYKEGYYFNWNDKSALLLAAKFGNSCTIETINEVIETSLKCGIFDQNMFNKFSILTSKGIQERYLKVTDLINRKINEIAPEHDLLGGNPCLLGGNSEETPVYSEETPINSEFSAQRKEKERKGKEKKEKIDTIPLLDTESLKKDLEKKDETNNQKPESESQKFIPPTIEEIFNYCTEKNYPDYSDRFFTYFSVNNWYVGKGKAKSKMKNWKLAIETWHNNNAKFLIQHAFGKNSELADTAGAKNFVKKLLCEVGEEETTEHLVKLQKANFRKLSTMEEQTQVTEEIQTDGTVKKILTIKPREENGNTGNNFTNTNNTNSKSKQYIDFFAPERLQADYEYFKQFERP